MERYTKEEKILLWLDSFLGLEYKHKAYLIDYVKESSGIEDFLLRAGEYISSAIPNASATIKWSANEEYLERNIKELNTLGVRAVTIFSKDYPKSLLNTEIPPIVLYAKGNVKLLNESCFGIVGSRKSLPLSLKITENYVKSLSTAFTFVTGCAEGVDAQVLQTALDEKANVISVMAGGFKHVYPKANQDLIEKVSENGLVITEYPIDVTAQRFHFPVRNRIIAGLSKGVLIVSGGIKSGTLYTAEYAEEYGRDLFAIPYGVGVASGEGCNDLIKRGAHLTDTPKDVLDFYGIVEKEQKEQLTQTEKEIIKVLSQGQMHVEKLCQALGKKTFEITPTLSMLEIKGYVVKSGNFYGVTRNYLEE